MKLPYGVIGLAFAPLVCAGNDTSYPTEKLAAFVFEKADVTSFPFAIRPKTVKGKKTFGDYGYVTREVDEKKALHDSPQGRRRFRSKYWKRRSPEFSCALIAKHLARAAQSYNGCCC
jgi:hypothetical protein